MGKRAGAVFVKPTPATRKIGAPGCHPMCDRDARDVLGGNAERDAIVWVVAPDA